jgi:hypothetical protein
MPIYDLVCANGHEQVDVLLKIGERPPCPECGSETSTLWRSSAGVIPDDIPGGVEIKHGLCNPDGSPRRFYSKTEIAREASRRGLVNHVEHVTGRGTDKNPHTTRWV